MLCTPTRPSRTAARLAEESCQIEIERCNEPIGKQDQYAAAFGGFNFIRFHPDDSVEVKKVLCAPSLIADLQSPLALFLYGAHAIGFVVVAAAVCWRSGRPVRSRMLQVSWFDWRKTLLRTCVRETSSSLGAMLHAAWQAKKQLVSGVTCDAIDEAYQAAIDAGAEGGKLLGAGGGGFLMFLAPPERHESIRERAAAVCGKRHFASLPTAAVYLCSLKSASSSACNRKVILEPGRAERNYWRDLWRYRELFQVLAWRDMCGALQADRRSASPGR